MRLVEQRGRGGGEPRARARERREELARERVQRSLRAAQGRPSQRRGLRRRDGGRGREGKACVCNG